MDWSEHYFIYYYVSCYCKLRWSSEGDKILETKFISLRYMWRMLDGLNFKKTKQNKLIGLTCPCHWLHSFKHDSQKPTYKEEQVLLLVPEQTGPWTQKTNVTRVSKRISYTLLSTWSLMETWWKYLITLQKRSSIYSVKIINVQENKTVLRYSRQAFTYIFTNVLNTWMSILSRGINCY